MVNIFTVKEALEIKQAHAHNEKRKYIFHREIFKEFNLVYLYLNITIVTVIYNATSYRKMSM